MKDRDLLCAHFPVSAPYMREAAARDAALAGWLSVETDDPSSPDMMTGPHGDVMTEAEYHARYVTHDDVLVTDRDFGRYS